MGAPVAACRSSGTEVIMPAHQADKRQRGNSTTANFGFSTYPQRRFRRATSGLSGGGKENRNGLSLPGNQIESSLPFVSFGSEKIPTLGHNLALVSVLYIGEQPEITPQDEESKKAKTSKEN